MVALLFEERDMALVERKIMSTHVINAVKLFFTMNTDVNVLSVTGVYIIEHVLDTTCCFSSARLHYRTGIKRTVVKGV